MADPISLLPVTPPFQGFNVDKGVEGAMTAAAPVVQASQTLKALGDEEEKKQKAIAYQKVLRGGPDLMKQYADEVATQYPELGAQLQKEAASYEPFFSDPNLKGEDAEKYASHFYESADSRVKALKDTQTKPEWHPATQQEAQDFYKYQQDNKAFPEPKPTKPSAGDQARSAKRIRALKEIPALWAQIEEMQKSGGEVPLVPGTLKPDTQAYMESQAKPWRKKWEDLRKRLNSMEGDAGMTASTEIMGPDLEKSSESYRHYKAIRSSGAPDVSPNPAAGNQKVIPPDLLDWLRKSVGKTDSATVQRRARVMTALTTQGVDTSAL